MGVHIPTRQCICCRERQSKYDLLRIVKTEEGFLVDRKGNAPGRGAYICKACLKNPDLIKKRPLDRAFRMKVEDEVYQKLWDTEEK